MENKFSIIAIVLGISLGVFVFILLRDVFLWYFKINVRIKLMEEQSRLLRKLANESEP
jgi:hypothetical protein